jgi:hypothetical protein
MQEDPKVVVLNEQPTDAEIMRTIRYLDPDSCAHKTGESTEPVHGVGITLLTVLAGAPTYIGLYIRTL